MDLKSALELHVRELSLPRGRRVGQPGHATAREYLLRQMEAVGLEPFLESGFEITYQDCGQRFANLVGRVRGTEEIPPVLIGAHYDSAIDGPSSDDNAAAVAIGLEAARALAAAPVRREVVVAFFDAEEPPYFRGPAMGSIRFFEDHWRGAELACAIIMDLVGHDVEPLDPVVERLIPALSKFLFVMGSESSPTLPGVVRGAAERVPDLRVVPALHDYVGDLSDHYPFRIAGKPFLFLSCGQGKHYHSPRDTPEWLNWEKIGHTCEFVLQLARGFDETTGRPGSPHDTVAFEIEMIERATGLSRTELASAIGLESLKTRSDLDWLAEAFSRQLVVWAQQSSE